MYWVKGLVGEGTEAKLEMAYFTLKLKPNTVTGTYYNSWSRETIYPANYELVVDTGIFRDETDFLAWYLTNIKL